MRACGRCRGVNGAVRLARRLRAGASGGVASRACPFPPFIPTGAGCLAPHPSFRSPRECSIPIDPATQKGTRVLLPADPAGRATAGSSPPTPASPPPPTPSAPVAPPAPAALSAACVPTPSRLRASPATPESPTPPGVTGTAVETNPPGAVSATLVLAPLPVVSPRSPVRGAPGVVAPSCEVRYSTDGADGSSAYGSS